jgi:hypothetical protein
VTPSNDEDQRAPSVQENAASYGGTVYAYQGQGDQIIHTPPHQPVPTKRRLRGDTVVLLVLLTADVIFFLYGMNSYTGTDTNAERWRALIFIAMLAVTGSMVRRWFRRRF